MIRAYNCLEAIGASEVIVSEHTNSEGASQEASAHDGGAPLQAAPSAVDARRRRLTGAGLSASGVLLSLACRPIIGHAAVSSTCHVSAGSTAFPNKLACPPPPQPQPLHHTTLQNNEQRLAEQGAALPYSRGAAPAYWLASATDGRWSEAKNLACDTAFGAVFPQCSASPTHGGRSLLESLQPTSAVVSEQLGQLLAAAYLNVVSGKTVGYIDQAGLQQMAAGTFVPQTGGAAWDNAKVVAFLKITMESNA